MRLKDEYLAEQEKINAPTHKHMGGTKAIHPSISIPASLLEEDKK